MYEMGDFIKDSTTTNAYDASTDLELPRGRDRHIAISNTHISNTLDWKVVGFFTDQGSLIEHEIKAEAALSPSSAATYEISEGYVKVLVRVKANTPDAQATYTIEACQEMASKA
jgi:hypothetical protein